MHPSPVRPAGSTPASSRDKMHDKKARNWRGMPGGAVGLAGSRNSTLRDKILQLPDFVQEAMDQSMGRSPIRTAPRRTQSPPPGPYEFHGGEARLQAEREAQDLERKLEGENVDKKKHVSKTLPTRLRKANLSRSISAAGLSRCLEGHADSQKRLMRVEQICSSASAPKLDKSIIYSVKKGGVEADASSRKNRMKGGMPSHLKHPSERRTSAASSKLAKGRWKKVRNVIRGGLGLASAAAAMRKGLQETSILTEKTEGRDKSGPSTDSPNHVSQQLAGTKSLRNRLHPRRSPRLPDGRIVPPWIAPPSYSLPLNKAMPRDIALLRVCRIPREWAEQWLSGRDSDDKTTQANARRVKEKERLQISGDKSGNRDTRHRASVGSKDRSVNKKRAKRSAMSWDAARTALPHSHTYLFRSTGRFVTVILDRQRILAMLREHPMGPSQSSLAEIVNKVKSERPDDGGPGPATFDRALADNVTSKFAPRAVMSSATKEGSLPPGGHEHAQYLELRQLAHGPGPGSSRLPGFGDRPTIGGAMAYATHESAIPVTPGDAGISVATPSSTGGPGAAAYDTRPRVLVGGGVKWSHPVVNRPSLGEATSPAPHDYDVRRGEALLSTTRSQTTGGVIAGRDKSEDDRQILAASQRPGPLDYSPKLPKSAQGAPRMSTSFGPSEMERVAMRAAETPGPGLYFMSTGSRPPYVPPPGAPRFRNGNYHTPLDLIVMRAKETPGPGACVKWHSLSQYPSADRQVKMKYPPNESRDDAELRRRGKLPGPAKYADAYLTSGSARMAGGRFSTAFPEKELDTIARVSATMPGPDEYQHPLSDATSTAGRPTETRVAIERKLRGVTIKAKLPTMTELAYRRGAKMPGAGKIIDDSSVRPRPGNVKIFESQAKSDVEWKIYRSKQIPGPGNIVDISATKPSPAGGRFNIGNAKSDLEWTIHRAMQTPGPGNVVNDRATRKNFGKAVISWSHAKSQLEEAIYKASQEPGPADYQPDLRNTEKY